MEIKYYLTRALAAALFMGSAGLGIFVGSEYGGRLGILVFIVVAPTGIVLHLLADRNRQA